MAALRTPTLARPGPDLGSVFERAPAPMIAVHPTTGELRDTNARARQLLELSDEAALQLCADRFFSNAQELFRLLRAVAEQGDQVFLEVRLRTLSGREFWARIEATAHEDFVLLGLQNIDLYVDQAEALRGESEVLRSRLNEVRSLAERDTLTGLPNRRAYDDAAMLTLRRARALAAPLCLAVLDIDYFKNVNDAYGHVTGDRVLARIGAIAGDALRRTDFVARYGGEEFVVLMPDTEPAEAKSVLERLREEIERSHVLAPNGTPVRVTASVGVAALEDTDSPEQLLERADRALYRAKSRGRNRLESGAAHPTRP